MNANELATLLATRPFEPLLVQLRDGRTYEIHRPGMAIVTPSQLVVGLSRENGSRLAERIVRCPTDEIVAVEPVATPQ